MDALSRYDGLQAIRLTALGRYALGLSDRYEPPAAGEQLNLLSNLDTGADTGLPGTLQILLDDVAHRAGRLTDLDHARMIDCADAAMAALIAKDRDLRGLCRPLGERLLAVPLEAEPKFQTGFRRLAHVMPSSLG